MVRFSLKHVQVKAGIQGILSLFVSLTIHVSINEGSNLANVFVTIDCKQRKVVLTTLSARKAQSVIRKGLKVEIWIDNIHFDTVYSNQIKKFQSFILQEKQYIGRKQRLAEEKNKRRKRGK
jgi:hypothetical protein